MVSGISRCLVLMGLLCPALAWATTPMITAGSYHTCALTSSGGVKCWGINNFGQLGDGSTTDRLTAVDVNGLTSGVTAISAGSYNTCALTNGGGVKCWGLNSHGQLGSGNTTNRLTPVDVIGLTSGVSAIATGAYHACALINNGLKCWGWNVVGQLGDGLTTDRLTPGDVSGLTAGVSSMAAGLYHTCALTSAGGVKCWGSNNWSQLGDGSSTNRLIPGDVSGLTNGVSTISAGAFHNCVLTNGAAKCWGTSYYGVLGMGAFCCDRPTPVDVTGLTTGVSSINGGAYHTCASTNGGLKCWGWNRLGQLGDGGTTNQASPVDVSGLTSGVSAFATGGYHSCSLIATGGAKCWGSNTYGQLGDGTTTNRSMASAFVSGL